MVGKLPEDFQYRDFEIDIADLGESLEITGSQLKRVKNQNETYGTLKRLHLH